MPLTDIQIKNAKPGLKPIKGDKLRKVAEEQAEFSADSTTARSRRSLAIHSSLRISSQFPACQPIGRNQATQNA
jgi:hypothetical protein